MSPSRARRPLSVEEDERVSHAPYFTARVSACAYRVDPYGITHIRVYCISLRSPSRVGSNATLLTPGASETSSALTDGLQNDTIIDRWT